MVIISFKDAIAAGQLSTAGPFDFTMNSTTAGERWFVMSSATGLPGTFSPISAPGLVLGTGTDELNHVATGPLQNFYMFGVVGATDNVLINEVSAVAAAVPEPATWAMMLLGFIGLAAAFRQRRRSVGYA